MDNIEKYVRDKLAEYGLFWYSALTVEQNLDRLLTETVEYLSQRVEDLYFELEEAHKNIEKAREDGYDEALNKMQSLLEQHM